MTEIKEIIDFAIKKEEEAYDLYNGFAQRTDNQAVKKLLEELAADELGHKEILQNLSKTKEILKHKTDAVQDLKLSDHLLIESIDENSEIQDVLIFAMKAEKSTYELYLKMADSAIDTEITTVFGKLAQIELNHKNKLESLYDDIFYADN
jgi:rubrerythrin